MFCSRCGSQISDGAGFCGACGTPVGQTGLPVVPSSPGSSTPSAPSAKSRRGLWAALIAATVVVIAAAVTVPLLLTGDDGGTTAGTSGVSTTPASTVAATTQTTQAVTTTTLPVSYVGEWSGTTDQGFPLRLVVQEVGGQQYIVEVEYKIEFPDWSMSNPAAKFEQQIPVSRDGSFANDSQWMLGISGRFSGDSVSGRLFGRPDSAGWMMAGDEVTWAPEGTQWVGETGFTATR